jgi:peptidoglycan/LPS O-acetylase OafA/YrhL
MKRNSSIDTIRLVAAVLVIFLHIPELYNHLYDNPIINAVMAVARLAVPFFFVISGYFAYNNSAEKQALKLRRNIIKLSKITLFAFAIYFILGLAIHRIDVGNFLEPFNYFKFFFLNCTLDFTGVKLLWFLPALICIEMLFWGLTRIFGKRLLLFAVPLSLAAFLGGLAISTYSPLLFGQVVSSPDMDNYYLLTNFLAHGLVFYCLGFVVRKYQDKLTSLSNARLIVLTLLSFAALFVEFMFLANQSGQPLGLSLLPTIFCILMVLNRYPGWFSKTSIPELGAQYALYIYIYQIIAREITTRLLSVIGWQDESLLRGSVIWLVTLVICIVGSSITIKLKNRLFRKSG